MTCISHAKIVTRYYRSRPCVPYAGTPSQIHQRDVDWQSRYKTTNFFKFVSSLLPTIFSFQVVQNLAPSSSGPIETSPKPAIYAQVDAQVQAMHRALQESATAPEPSATAPEPPAAAAARHQVVRTNHNGQPRILLLQNGQKVMIRQVQPVRIVPIQNPGAPVTVQTASPPAAAPEPQFAPKSKHPCPEGCGRMLGSKTAIKKHLFTHRPQDEWPFQCRYFRFAIISTSKVWP